jgi:putative nucleotidyltransferase with HDIG domain
MCGLLHDLGIILLDQHQHHAFVEVLAAASADVPTCDAERKQLSFDHAQLGAAVARNWGFPPVVVESIRTHHDSMQCEEEYRPIACTVEIANYLCSKKGITSIGVANIGIPNPAAFALLSIGRNDLKVLCQDLDAELQVASDLYQL